MKFYFLSNTNMSKKAVLITTVAISAALAVISPVNAEKSQVNLNTLKETHQPVCKTTLECEELAISLESQINEIEANEPLTKEDKKVRYKLRKQLIKVHRQITAQAKQRTAEAKQERINSEKVIEAQREILETLKRINGIVNQRDE